MKKTILMIGDSIYPDNMGGSHRHIYDLSKKLTEIGYRVLVITPNKNNQLSEFEKIDGIEYYRYFRNGNTKIKGFIDFIVQPLKKYNEIKKSGIKIDIIHGHWTLTNYLIFRKVKDAKKIYTLHGPTFEEYEYELKFRFIFIKKVVLLAIKSMEKRVLNNSNYIITASEYMKDKVLNYYGFEEKIKVIPVGTDTEKFKPRFVNKKKAKEDLGIDMEKIIIMSIRRLKRRMGLDNLIKAIKIVSERFNNVELLIGGKGDYKEELENLVEELQISNKVRFIGFVKEDKLSEYYESADLFVIPSIDLEGFGLVTTEAMAVGTLVIGTPIGGNKEVIGKFDKNLLANSISEKDIAKKIIEVLERNNISSNTCRAYVVKNYGWNKVLPEIIRLYLE